MNNSVFFFFLLCHGCEQVIYNDNQSLTFHSGYGFNPDMGYGQYSPVATPLTPIVLDGQLYSPQQIPFSPFYHPNMPSSGPLGSSELTSSESNGENSFFGPGSGYMVQYGSYGGGNVPGAHGSRSLTSASAYPQPMGILGPYEHHAAQVCFILSQLLQNLGFPKVLSSFSYSPLLLVFLACHYCHLVSSELMHKFLNPKNPPNFY